MMVKGNNHTVVRNTIFATRESEVESLHRQVAQLKLELSDEKARHAAARTRADEASQDEGIRVARDEEMEGLREELSQAQQWAQRLQTASALVQKHQAAQHHADEAVAESAAAAACAAGCRDSSTSCRW